jgi:hypothetical protein
MSVTVQEKVLWDLADALGITIEFKDGKLRGSVKKRLLFGWVPVDVPLRIVSGGAVRDGMILLCTSLGAVGVVAVRRFAVSGVEIGLLDLDQLGEPPTNLFERKRSKDLVEACAALDGAEIRWFEKQGKAWAPSPTL